MNLLTIDAKQFKLGESQSRHEGDRGFSPESYGLNLEYDKGVLYGMGAATDIGGATLVDKVVARAKDKNSLGNDQYFLDASGNFYTLDGATFTKRQTDGSNTYQLGTSDMVQFQGNTYATSTDDVAKLTGSDLTALDATWWSTTLGNSTLQTSVRHPLEVVEDHLYIGDKNNIHAYDGSVDTVNAITLPTGVNVISLRKHTDGRTLLAFCGLTINYSHSLGLAGVVYYIDTVTWEFIREVPLESQVEGTINHEGAIMCTWGKNFGYFDGSGLQWLRDLESETTYSHNLESKEDTLLVRDDDAIIAWGDLGKGKVFWNLYQTGDSIDVIAYLGSGKVAFGYLSSSTEYLKYVDTDEVGVYGSFFSDPITLPGRVWVRRVEVDHDVSTTGVEQMNLYYKADDGSTETLGTISYGTTESGIRRARIDCNVLASIFAIGMIWSNGYLGVKKFTIYYESAE